MRLAAVLKRSGSWFDAVRQVWGKALPKDAPGSDDACHQGWSQNAEALPWFDIGEAQSDNSRSLLRGNCGKASALNLRQQCLIVGDLLRSHEIELLKERVVRR